MTPVLQHWYISPTGIATKLDLKVDTKRPKKTGYEWIHLSASHAEARQWLIDDPDIDLLATDTMLAQDSRPRVIVHDDSFLINLRGVNLNEGSDVTDMVGIRFIVTENRIVSIERRPLKATTDIAEQLEHVSPPETASGFLALFAMTLADRMAPTITDLSEKVDDLEETGDNDISNLDRTLLAELRRDVISLRRYLAPQRDALNSFSVQNFKWITELDKLHIRSAADQTTRITEELDTLRERCTVIRDHLTDHRAETMNNNMMILSVVAAIFLPLGLVSGMMGINVGGMPWVEDGNGFWYVTGIVIIVGCIQMFFFKLLKWI